MNFIKSISFIILITLPFASDFLYETESDNIIKTQKVLLVK